MTRYMEPAPLKRAIQRELENPLATMILETTFAEGAIIQVDMEDDHLRFAIQSTETLPMTAEHAAGRSQS